MKVAITGANGQLGSALKSCLEPFDLFLLTRADLDITNLLDSGEN